MALIDVLNQKGEVIRQYDLNDEIFGIEPHKDALYEAVKMQQAGKHQGTHAVKGRSQVSGGGRKPYRQKGTGSIRKFADLLLNLLFPAKFLIRNSAY